VISSLKDTPLPPKSVFIGEVGLNGEIRPVTQLESRINSALKLGYENIFISASAKTKHRAKVTKLHNVNDLFKVCGGRGAKTGPKPDQEQP
jgi:DNA repair protein RadA/Sms